MAMSKKCICDWCGGEIRIDEGMVDTWKNTLLHMSVVSRPQPNGGEAGYDDIFVHDSEDICLNCTKAIFSVVLEKISLLKLVGS